MTKYITEEDLEIHPDWFLSRRNSEDWIRANTLNRPMARIQKLVQNPQDKLGSIVHQMTKNKSYPHGGVILADRFMKSNPDSLVPYSGFGMRPVPRRMENRAPSQILFPSDAVIRKPISTSPRGKYLAKDKGVFHVLGHEVGHVADNTSLQNVTPKLILGKGFGLGFGSPEEKKDARAADWGLETRAWDRYEKITPPSEKKEIAKIKNPALLTYRFDRNDQEDFDIKPYYTDKFLPKYGHLFIDDSKKDLNMNYTSLVEDIANLLLEEPKGTPPYVEEWQKAFSAAQPFLSGKGPKRNHIENALAELASEFEKSPLNKKAPNPISTFRRAALDDLEHQERSLRMGREHKPNPLFDTRGTKEALDSDTQARVAALTSEIEKSAALPHVQERLKKQIQTIQGSVQPKGRRSFFSPEDIETYMGDEVAQGLFLGGPKRIHDIIAGYKEPEAKPRAEAAPPERHGAVDVTGGKSLSNRHGIERKDTGGKRAGKAFLAGQKEIGELEKQLDVVAPSIAASPNLATITREVLATSKANAEKAKQERKATKVATSVAKSLGVPPPPKK